ERPAIKPQAWEVFSPTCWAWGISPCHLRHRVRRRPRTGSRLRKRIKRKKGFSAKLWVSLKKTNRRPSRPNQRTVGRTILTKDDGAGARDLGGRRSPGLGRCS